MILIISLILYLLSSSPVFFYILIPILLLQALNSLSSSFNGAIPPSQGLARNTQRFSLHSSGPQTKALALAKDAESIAARKRKAAENEKGGAEAQEETTAAAVPLEEDSAMAAAGGSGSAANPSPSADEVPIVCDYDGWSCFRDDDVMQQQSAIRAEEAAKIPYVGDKEPLSSLAAEFQSGSPIVQEKIKLIGEQYSFLRRTRGDGNCFFRSFMFSYLEHILETQDKAEVERITVNIDQCKKTLQSLGYADFTFEDFFSIFIEQLESVLQGTDTSISHEELLQRSRYQNVSDYVVMFFRFVTSCEIRRRSDFFEPFIAGLTNSTVDQFCKASVEPMGEESDHVHITALSDALGVPIRVLYLDRCSCEAGAPTVNHHDFIPSVTLPNPPPVQGNGPTTTATDNVDPSVPPPDKIAVATSENSLPTPVVTLLYRPGHYDILYAK